MSLQGAPLNTSSAADAHPPAPARSPPKQPRLQAFPQCVFDHWELMGPDPLQSGSQTHEIVLNIRKRKGAQLRGGGWGMLRRGGRSRWRPHAPRAAACPRAACLAVPLCI